MLHFLTLIERLNTRIGPSAAGMIAFLIVQAEYARRLYLLVPTSPNHGSRSQTGVFTHTGCTGCHLQCNLERLHRHSGGLVREAFKRLTGQLRIWKTSGGRINPSEVQLLDGHAGIALGFRSADATDRQPKLRPTQEARRGETIVTRDSTTVNGGIVCWWSMRR